MMIDYEIMKMLIDITYVNLGMVPPSHYPKDLNGSLKACLESLDPIEARKAKRKFRKILRKSRKGKKGDHSKSSYDTRQSSVKWYVIDNYVKQETIDNDD
jgi:hypothetical protein